MVEGRCLDHDSIDFSIVEYGLETAVLFPNVENRSCKRGLQFMNKSSFQLILDIFGLEFFFGSGQGISVTEDQGQGIWD